MNDIAELVKMWTIPLDNDEPPLQFSDPLAMAFFVISLKSFVEAECNRAVKAERRRHKSNAVRRWKAKQITP